MPAPPTLVPRFNRYVTVAQLNFWFYAGRGDCSWLHPIPGDGCTDKRRTALTPLLGATYAAADPAVIHQQIEWAAQYGIDAFSIEWTTPRGVGTSGSMENTLDDDFLVAPNIAKVRWCIFDDFFLRLQQTPGVNFDGQSADFDDPQVADLFVADFDHFAQKYFGNPQYLTIDGRPVIYIWGTWNARGNIGDAMRRARAAAAAHGYDVFVAGDVITSGQFNPAIAQAYDADSNFTFMVGGSNFPNVDQAAQDLDAQLLRWEGLIDGLKVAGRNDDVIVQPGFTPQYDDRLFVDHSPIYIPAESRGQVEKMAETVRTHAHAAGDAGSKMVWLNTWNNWAETTTIEPTVDSGPKYPAGNYGFDMVDVVKHIFGPETFNR